MGIAFCISPLLKLSMTALAGFSTDHGEFAFWLSPHCAFGFRGYKGADKKFTQDDALGAAKYNLVAWHLAGFFRS